MSGEKDYGPRIGADPEMCITQLDSDVIIPVCGLVGGTKESPIIVSDAVRAIYGADGEAPRLRNRVEAIEPALLPVGDYAVQEDGVMLEFNIPAYTNRQDFCISIDKMLGFLTADLQARKLQLKLGIVDHAFTAKQLDSEQAKTIGCMPDMNAYALDGRFLREPFEASAFGNRRFCGGHIHLQYNHHNVPRHVMAQYMDIMAELPFLKFDKQKNRRAFYGQPGLFRKKPYGIEYRTLSSFWLAPSFRNQYLPYLAINVLDLGKMANEDPDKLHSWYSQIPWQEVQEAIKGENHKKADEIINRLEGTLNMPINRP